MRLVFAQLDGLHAGYSTKAPSHHRMSRLQVLQMSLGGDYEDLGESSVCSEAITLMATECSPVVSCAIAHHNVTYAQHIDTTLINFRRLFVCRDGAWFGRAHEAFIGQLDR